MWKFDMQQKFISMIYSRVCKPHTVFSCMTVDGRMPFTMFCIFSRISERVENDSQVVKKLHRFFMQNAYKRD